MFNRKKFFIVIACFIISLFSCTEDRINNKGKVYIVSVSFSYTLNDSKKGSLSDTPLNDILELTTVLNNTFSSRGISVEENLLIEYSFENSEFNNYLLDDEDNITNEKFPTKENVIKTIENVCKKADKNDLIVLLYSGHGSNEDGSMILADKKIKRDASSASFKPTYSRESYLSSKELSSILKKTNSQILIIMDSCYSGNFASSYDNASFGEDITLSGILADDEKISLIQSIFTSTLNLPNVSLLCSSSAFQQSYAIKGNSPFMGEGHGILIGSLLEELGLQHTNESILRVFEKSETGGNVDLTCYGVHNVQNKKIYFSKLYKKLKIDVSNIVGKYDSIQSPILSETPLDIVI